MAAKNTYFSLVYNDFNGFLSALGPVLTILLPIPVPFCHLPAGTFPVHIYIYGFWCCNPRIAAVAPLSAAVVPFVAVVPLSAAVVPLGG